MNTLTSAKPVTRTRPFIRRILVAVDLTARSLGTANYAVKVAKSFGASVVFVYVHPTEALFNFVTGGGYDLIDSEQRDRRHSLISLVDTVSKEYPFCTQTFLVGEPAQTVADFAREIEADLVIAGSHHPSFTTKLLQLDQAPKMVRLGNCPVLIYQGEDDRRSNW
jgi:nucleotide-binding universal stress UspA family protein